LPEHVLIPGLINTHTHTPMTLLRGFADDVNLQTWLTQHIWPAEQKWVDPSFCEDGTTLAVAEMLRSGTTCFVDMYFFPESSAKATAKAGMRAVIGAPVLMFPTKYASDPADYLKKGLKLLEEYHDHDLVQIAIAPHAPYTVSDDQLRDIRKAAEQHHCPVIMHVHETATEVSEAVEKGERRPLARLDSHDMLDASFVAVHMTQMTSEEISRVAKTGTTVVHCPESNTKLASGFCPVAKLLAAGANVSLGTDGAASNNDLDMFGEMRTAALLGKLECKDAGAVSAPQVLRMATINGAKAIGMDKKIGSLEKGKYADITAVKLGEIETSPMYNVISHLVFSCGRESVSNVWVAGKELLKDRKLTTLNEKEIVAKAKEWGDKIASTHDTPKPVVEKPEQKNS